MGKPRSRKSKWDVMEQNWRNPSNSVDISEVQTKTSSSARNWREMQDRQALARRENGNIVDPEMPDKDASVQEVPETMPRISQRKKRKLKKRALWQGRQEALVNKWGRDDCRFYLNGEFREDCPVPILGKVTLIAQKESKANHIWNTTNLDSDELPKPLVCPACNFRTLVYKDMGMHLHKKFVTEKLREISISEDSPSSLEAAEADEERSGESD